MRGVCFSEAGEPKILVQPGGGGFLVGLASGQFRLNPAIYGQFRLKNVWHGASAHLCAFALNSRPLRTQNPKLRTAAEGGRIVPNRAKSKEKNLFGGCVLNSKLGTQNSKLSPIPGYSGLFRGIKCFAILNSPSSILAIGQPKSRLNPAEPG